MVLDMKRTLMNDFMIDYKEYIDIYFQMNQVIRQVGVSNSVLVIDLANEVPHDNGYMYDDIHYNDNGSKYVSTLIANQLDKFFDK